MRLVSESVQLVTQEIDLLDEYSLSSYLIMAYVFHSKITRTRASKVYMCLECLFPPANGGSIVFLFPSYCIFS